MKRIFFSGLMLMSFFFGAGNLIFAPQVGLESGQFFGEALTGFTLTAVLIPFAAIIAVTVSGDSALSFAGRVSKPFGYIYSIILIFSIGPLFAIPRVANVSWNLGLSPIFATNNVNESILSVPGVSFVVVFFVISFVLTLFGEKLVDSIGKFLSPALIIFIVGLVVFFLFSGHTPTQIVEVNPKYATAGGSAARGAIEGYGTLDALAAVCFASIIVGAIAPSVNATKKEILLGVIKAGAIAVTLLSIIYIALAYMGNISADSGATSGSDLLVFGAEKAFGTAGQYVFALIVILACLTTAVGVLKTVSSYSSMLFGGKEAYWLVFFTLFSALLSIQGLDSVIKTSVPVIYLTYPITISLIIVTLFNPITKQRAWIYRLTTIAVLPFAIADGVKYSFIMFDANPVDILGLIRGYIPFGNTDFSWVLPFIAAFLIGIFLPKEKVKTYRLEHIRDARYKKYAEALDSEEDVNLLD